MTENNKPEWFEIADNDRPTTRRKASKTLPLAAVLAASLIIGLGAVVAQTQEESPANAIEATQTPSTATNVSTSPSTAVTPTSSSASNETVAPATKSVAKVSVKPSANPSGLQNPAIAKLPTKGGGDDEHEGREGRGNHEDNEGDDD
jgi:cytoskeletal protein RodZ